MLLFQINIRAALLTRTRLNVYFWEASKTDGAQRPSALAPAKSHFVQLTYGCIFSQRANKTAKVINEIMEFNDYSVLLLLLLVMLLTVMGVGGKGICDADLPMMSDCVPS